MAKALMVQGTSSNVGKSVLCTALCRILRQEGYRVAPFKSQNMSGYSFVTGSGEEMARSQAIQAEAAGVMPVKQMNPSLIKPLGGQESEVLIHGEKNRVMSADEYWDICEFGVFDVVRRSYECLSSQYDVIIIEGAGSPVEMNIKDRDIANMRVAKMARAPVILVADIDLGGVFASLVGTLKLLADDERDIVDGLVINKFRGVRSAFEPGVDFLEKRTRKPVLGVLPYIRDIGIAEEDLNRTGRVDADGPQDREDREAAYDRLAAIVRENLNIGRILDMVT